MTRASGGFRRGVAAMILLGTAALAGCSGAGLLPYDDGPHYISPQQLGRIVATQAQYRGLSPALLRAVIDRESGEDPTAVSEAGAVGLMQLMPATAAEYGVNDPFDAEQNVAGGAAYLADLLRAYHGNVGLALAAYNAGPGAVARYRGIPPYAETQAYVRSVSEAYRETKTGR